MTDPCACGCGDRPALIRSFYLPGHDSKHLSKAGKAILAGDGVSAWVLEMPTIFQVSRLSRYLSKRGINLDAEIANEQKDCV